MSAVEVVTFGCRLNAHESAAMARRAQADGLGPSVIVNTCAVTAEAVRQGRQAVRSARRRRPDARLIVTGCAAQIDPAAFAALPGVDLVLGNAGKSAPGALMRRGIAVGDIFQARGVAPAIGEPPPKARACVEVQTGCDHRCTFCVIPFGRGDARSKPPDAIVAEARALAAAGTVEVVLTGVDLTSWGQAKADLGDRRFAGGALGRLVRRILDEVPELPRLRLSSIDAAEIDADLIAAFGERRLMPYLHLSLQSGDDLILKRMKRRHSRARALATIAEVRATRPETTLGADFIVGFPTEDDEAFERTASLVEEAGLSFLHVFPYSPRPGTPAARMPQVPPAVVRARATRLRGIASEARRRHLDALVGARIRVLVERPDPDNGGLFMGKAEDFTDALCKAPMDGNLAVGDIIAGRVASHDGRAARLADGQTARA